MKKNRRGDQRGAYTSVAVDSSDSEGHGGGGRVGRGGAGAEYESDDEQLIVPPVVMQTTKVGQGSHGDSEAEEVSHILPHTNEHKQFTPRAMFIVLNSNGVCLDVISLFSVHR